MRYLAALALAFAAFALPAQAAEPQTAQPDLLSFGIGYYDALQNHPRNEAVDFRLEHRWGVSLLPKIHESLAAVDPYVQVRPFAGLEGTSDGALYTLGGFVFDIPIGKHFVISPSEAVGFYYRGDGKRLGSFVEFRSTMELGWRFNDESRLTAAFGHISNAGLTDLNPGTEIATLYYHIPTSWVFGN